MKTSTHVVTASDGTKVLVASLEVDGLKLGGLLLTTQLMINGDVIDVECVQALSKPIADPPYLKEMLDLQRRGELSD